MSLALYVVDSPTYSRGILVGKESDKRGDQKREYDCRRRSRPQARSFYGGPRVGAEQEEGRDQQGQRHECKGKEAQWDQQQGRGQQKRRATMQRKERQHSGSRDHDTECDCAYGSLEVPTQLMLAEKPHKGKGRACDDYEGAGHLDEHSLFVHVTNYIYVWMEPGGDQRCRICTRLKSPMDSNAVWIGSPDFLITLSTNAVTVISYCIIVIIAGAAVPSPLSMR